MAQVLDGANLAENPRLDRQASDAWFLRLRCSFPLGDSWRKHSFTVRIVDAGGGWFRERIRRAFDTGKQVFDRFQGWAGGDLTENCQPKNFRPACQEPQPAFHSLSIDPAALDFLSSVPQQVGLVSDGAGNRVDVSDARMQAPLAGCADHADVATRLDQFVDEQLHGLPVDARNDYGDLFSP